LNRFEQLDVTAFDRYFSGIEHGRSVELYLKLANLFLKGLDDKLTELKNALSSHQQQDARVIAHRIRGSLLSLGGNNLAKLFYEIENGLGEKVDADLLALLGNGKDEISQFLDELGAWMETLEASVKSSHNA
jgi:HPt (histidine-containing phosphotransfer) domain-containing protein